MRLENLNFHRLLLATNAKPRGQLRRLLGRWQQWISQALIKLNAQLDFQVGDEVAVYFIHLVCELLVQNDGHVGLLILG